MHTTLDILGVCTAVLLLMICAAVLARQRYMLRLPGAIALAVQVPSRNTRWLYGMGRYVGGEFRWYRALGFGTRPSRVVRRDTIEVLRRREPYESEIAALPLHAVVLECRAGEEPFTMALSEGAYTGFVSWLESAAPMG